MPLSSSLLRLLTTLRCKKSVVGLMVRWSCRACSQNRPFFGAKMVVTAAGAAKGGAATTAGSGGGGRQTLHHFFAKKPPPAAASSQAGQAAAKAMPNSTSRVGSKIPTAPPTPPTPAAQPQLLQVRPPCPGHRPGPTPSRWLPPPCLGPPLGPALHQPRCPGQGPAHPWALRHPLHSPPPAAAIHVSACTADRM